jgi:hypothetical protein
VCNAYANPAAAASTGRPLAGQDVACNNIGEMFYRLGILSNTSNAQVVNDSFVELQCNQIGISTSEKSSNLKSYTKGTGMHHNNLFEHKEQ